MSGVELAACPFCGGKASLIDNRPIGLCYCMCDLCDAQCGGGWESARLAREEWNRRAVPMEAVAWRYAHKNTPNDWRLAEYDIGKDWPNLICQALAVIPAPGKETVSTNEVGDE